MLTAYSASFAFLLLIGIFGDLVWQARRTMRPKARYNGGCIRCCYSYKGLTVQCLLCQ